MEKVNQYKKIIRELCRELARMSPSDEQVETQLVMDDERGHYLLFSVGWEQDYREYAPFVHIDVKPDGKVFIQHDGTDLQIALLLVEKGIPKSDIVLAFHPQHQRVLLPEFAVA
ncbi:MAG TPA: XisI protein [Saprospiraceae bacterium]|nr:XisI protein [Saprospiraceae bacterium]